MFNKVKRYIRDPYYSFGYDLMSKYPHLMSDKFYLSTLWKMKMGYELNWKHPSTFNEKLQWLKLYDRNPLYTILVDKYRVKKWVADIIGEEYVIPTLAVYSSVDQIDLGQLPNQFVLKCNHDSGSVVICKDKSTFDLDAAKIVLNKALKSNFYWETREWPYKNVEPCIFAEELLSDNGCDCLTDYKLMAFNNRVKCSFTCTSRWSDSGLHVTFYDLNWNIMPFERYYPADKKPIGKPVSFNKMVEFAERLSQSTLFSRIDFYEVNNTPLFGEITFYPGGGFEPFTPPSWDQTLGDWLKLPVD